MRRCSAFLPLLAFCAAASAATLQYLTLDEMTAQATAVVRGTIVASHTTTRGPVIYTLYTMQVSERIKGGTARTIDIAVPGGVANGIRQTFAGAPALETGGEYVVFTWQSKSGLNLIMGLSQGLFTVSEGSGGAEASVSQSGTSELVLNSRGQEITTTPLRLSIGQLRDQVKRVGAAQ